VGCFTVLLKAIDPYLGEAAQAFMIHVYRTEQPRLAIEYPPSGKEVGGSITVRGSAERGLMDITAIEFRIDGGRWRNATGTLNWSYVLDTTALKNGRHTLQARAFDREEYSEEVNATFVVNNGESLTLGGSMAPLTVVIAVALACLAGVLAFRRWRKWEYI
jgi:hypothetical protein